MATTLTTPTTVCFLARETPPPPLELNLNGNYPYYPKYRLFFRETPPPLCAWYTSLFLAFITLSDLYYPQHPPSEGCTFRVQK